MNYQHSTRWLQRIAAATVAALGVVVASNEFDARYRTLATIAIAVIGTIWHPRMKKPL